MIKQIKQFGVNIWDKVKTFSYWCKKKVKQIAVVLGIIGVVTASTMVLTPPQDIETRFEWQSATNEIIELRTYVTKDFPHPTDPDKRIRIQSSALLHYYDNGFKDIYKLPFPEGLETSQEKTKVIDVPVWGIAKIEDNGKTLKIFDKKNTPIYEFTNLISVEKGIEPYQVVDKDGNKLKNTKDRKQQVEFDEKIELRKDINIDFPIFEVEGKEVFVKQPKTRKNSYPVELYDDTYTKQPSSKDSDICEAYPTENTGSLDYMWIDSRTGTNHRWGIVEFDISNFPGGTISDVKLALYYYYYHPGLSNPSGRTILAYKITRTDWVESEVSWNIYKTGSNWTSGGGDYVTSNPSGGSAVVPASYGWMEWDIKAIVEDAIDNVSGMVELLLKDSTDSGSTITALYSRDYTVDTDLCPYVEITYTPAAGTNIQVNIGDIWKEVDSIKINIGDVWKDVSGTWVNVGDSWKVIY